MECYLDNAATTRPFSEVCDLVTRVMYEDFGNPSSLHMKGVIAERYVRQAREQIAKTLKCAAKNIVFTSGGTESNNMALIGSALANARAGKHIITTCFEHAAVYEPLLYLEKMGYEVTYLPVDSMGHVSEETLENALRKDTILVSTMLVNNEVGAILDVEKFSKIVKAFNKDIIFHVDAIQAYGKMNIYPKRMGIDLLSVSGHKIHGPKGTGFLYPKNTTTLTIPSTSCRAISVGAYDGRTFSYADFSGRGPLRGGSGMLLKPELVAPGVDITTVAAGGGYASFTGTSFATPFVTGAAALLMEWGIVNGNDPYLYGEKVKAYLRRGARPLPGFDVYPNPQVGWGALCVRESLPT